MGKQDLHPKPPPPKISWKVFTGEKNPVVSGDEPKKIASPTTSQRPLQSDDTITGAIGQIFTDPEKANADETPQDLKDLFNTDISQLPVKDVVGQDQPQGQLTNAPSNDPIEGMVDRGTQVVNEMGKLITEPDNLIKLGLTQINNQSPLKGSLNLINGIIGGTALPFTALDFAMRKTPFFTDIVTDALKLPRLGELSADIVGSPAKLVEQLYPIVKGTLSSSNPLEQTVNSISNIVKEKYGIEGDYPEADQLAKGILTMMAYGGILGKGSKSIGDLKYETGDNIKKLTPEELHKAVVSAMEKEKTKSIITTLRDDADRLKDEFDNSKDPVERLKILDSIEKNRQKTKEYEQPPVIVNEPQTVAEKPKIDTGEPTPSTEPVVIATDKATTFQRAIDLYDKDLKALEERINQARTTNEFEQLNELYKKTEQNKAEWQQKLADLKAENTGKIIEPPSMEVRGATTPANPKVKPKVEPEKVEKPPPPKPVVKEEPVKPEPPKVEEPVKVDEPPKRIAEEEIKLKGGKWEITDPVDGSKTSFSTYAEAEKYLKRAKDSGKDYPDLSKETNTEIKEHKVKARKYKSAVDYITKVLKIPIEVKKGARGFGAVSRRGLDGRPNYVKIQIPNKRGIKNEDSLWHEVGHVIDEARKLEGKGNGNLRAKRVSGIYSDRFKPVIEKNKQYIHDNTQEGNFTAKVSLGNRRVEKYTTNEEIMKSPHLSEQGKIKLIRRMEESKEVFKAYRNQSIELFANGFKEYVLHPEKMLKEAPELHAMYEQVFKEAPLLKDFYEYEVAKDIVRDAVTKDSGVSFGGMSKLGDITDPKVLKAVYTVAKYIIKDGVKKFGEFAKRMFEDVGQWIRPKLKEIWEKLNNPNTLPNVVAQGFNISKKAESVEPNYSQFKRTAKREVEQKKTEPPKAEEIKRAKKVVINDILRNGKKTEEFVNAIAPMKNARMHQKDVIWKLKGDKEKFRQEVDMMYEDINKKIEKMSQKEQIAIFDKLKRGEKQDTPELQAFADLHRKIDTKLWQEINQYKPLNWLENHFRIFMKKPEGEVPLSISSRRNLSGEGGYFKQMTLPDMSAWVERGIEPISYNPVVNAKLDYSSKMKFITANRMLENFLKTGDAVYVKPKGDPPVGFKKIDDAISNTYFGGKKGGYYFEPSVARLLNNYLSQDLIRQNQWGNFFFSIKNSTTAVELAIPSFHFLFETAEATSSQMARGIRRAWNVGVLKANPLEFVKGVGEFATSPLASITLAKAGTKVFKYLKNPLDFAKSDFGKEVLKQFPDFEQFVDDMFTGGMRLGMHDMDARGLPKVLGKVMHPLFNVYIPRLKAGAFLHEYGLALKENAKSLDSGALTRGELARRSLNFVEDRFGEMNWDNLMLNHTLKSALQLTFRSVTWKTGDVRGLIGAVPEQIRGIKNLTGREKANVSQRMAWLMGLAVTHGILSAVTQYAFIGETPKDYRDLLAPRYDKTDPEKRISLPTYIKDVYHLAKDIPSFVTSSMSGFLGKAYELWYNRDFFGYNIYNPRHPMFIPDGVDNWYETQFLESMWHLLPKPFAVGNLLSNSDMSNLKKRFIQMGTIEDFPDFVSKYGGFAGLQKAARVLSRTSMQNEIDMLYNKRYGGGTKSYEQKEEATLKNELRTLFKTNPAEFERQSEEAVKEGKLTAKQVLNISGNKVPVDVYLFRFLPDDDKEYLYKKMTPEEKELYGEGIAKETLRKKLGLPEREGKSPKTLQQMKNRLNKKSDGSSLKSLKDKYK